MKTLADRISETRRELGLRQADLAEAAGVSEAAVSQWERGDVKNMKHEHLFAVADLLKVNARWLALGIGPRFLRAAMWALFAVLPLTGPLYERVACVLCKKARSGTISRRETVNGRLQFATAG